MIIRLYIVNDVTDNVLDTWQVIATSIDKALSSCPIPPENYHIEYKVELKGI